MNAIVIGAGANELVAAHMLARAGYRVVVLQENEILEEDVGWVPPPIVRALQIEDRLEICAADPWATIPLPGGGQLELWRDMARSVEAIRRVSPRDAAMWPEFCERMARLARLLERLYTETPRNPLDVGLALRLRRLGRQGLEDLMRLAPMPVAELLDDWFETDALKGALGAAGVMGLQQGPRSGGTSFRLLHHHAGSPAGVFRPPRSSLGRVLKGLPGLELRQAEAKQILVRDGRAKSVILENGEEIAAPLVVCGATPRRSLLELADPGWLDPDLVRAIRHIRCRGVVAKMEADSRTEGLVVAPSLDYLERAYDEVKYGHVSREPYLELAGGQVHLQYVPDGHRDDAELAALASRVLSQHLPGIAIDPQSVLAPPPEAELTLDQALWMRPLPELARYRTPIEGLWLCGASMHPGDAIAGAAGYNCARELLRELR